MKKFLLVDDHHVVRSGIREILPELYKPVEIDEAADETNALEKLKHNQYDLIMLDIQLPKGYSFALAEFLFIKYPAIRVLIFSTNSESMYAKRFLKAGAKGFLSKQAPLEEIKKAVNLVLNGRRYVSEALGRMLAGESFNGNKNNPFDKLSKREFEIVLKLLSGNSVKEISRSLKIEASTIGAHKSNLFCKLGITNTLQLKELAPDHEIH